MKTFKHWWLAAAVAAIAMAAQAADYPARSIQVIVPFPAGAAADHAMRVIARRMSEQLKQPIVIENRPGVPGIFAAAKAQPDGYTLLLGAGSNMVTHPLMVSKLVYNPSRDFVPVGRAIVNVPILTTHPTLGVSNAQELIALAKKKPGRLDYSSSGAGSPGHLSMEMFQLMTGTHMVHIPYKGGAPAVNELMGGHVHLGINALPSVLGPVRNKKLMPIAVASRKRSPALPEVPTLAESGVPGFDYEIWYAMFAPARTPPDVVNTVSQALQSALRDPEVARQLVEQGADPSPSTPQELADYVQRDRVRWAKVIKERNLKID
ncbi:MAG TPA: tripartite tricarboxylate transporter substrate binding protein [Ramlibacter sp.]|nr:tripartite tricarboxylate transporter substrate binding protein [Ramlibacter sp.]